MCLDGRLWEENFKGRYEQVALQGGPSFCCLISAVSVGSGWRISKWLACCCHVQPSCKNAALSWAVPQVNEGIPVH